MRCVMLSKRVKNSIKKVDVSLLHGNTLNFTDNVVNTCKCLNCESTEL